MEGACHDACCDAPPKLAKQEDFEKASDCPTSKLGIETAVAEEVGPKQSQPTDIESDATREHFVYRVSRMTCTGCSKKVSRVLGEIEGVFSVQFTFVTCIREFDLNTAVVGVGNLSSHLERATGFKLSREVSTLQSLDLQTDTLVVAEASCSPRVHLITRASRLRTSGLMSS